MNVRRKRHDWSLICPLRTYFNSPSWNPLSGNEDLIQLKGKQKQRQIFYIQQRKHRAWLGREEGYFEENKVEPFLNKFVLNRWNSLTRPGVNDLTKTHFKQVTFFGNTEMIKIAIILKKILFFWKAIHTLKLLTTLKTIQFFNIRWLEKVTFQSVPSLTWFTKYKTKIY